MRRYLITLVMVQALYFVCVSLGQEAAQPPSDSTQDSSADDPSKIDTEKWSQVYLTIAKQIEMKGQDDRSIKLVPESLLHWDNPIRVGRTEGDFYVWTNGQRPVMVGTVFSYDAPVSQHAIRALAFELHTLSKSPLRVERNGKPIWETPKDSFQTISLNDLPKPRSKRFQRLSEMRQIARRLSASTELEGTDQPLRLLPNPIHRFELPETPNDKTDLLDGAVFAMVTGTDPELLVFIQANRDSKDTFAWHLTPARFTNLPIKLHLDKELLWDDSDEAATYRPYIGVHRIYHLPTSLGEEALATLNE